MTYKRYTVEFREEAVRQVTQRGCPDFGAHFYKKATIDP